MGVDPTKLIALTSWCLMSLSTAILSPCITLKTEDRFLTAVTDYTLQRIEKAKENLGFRGAE